MKKLELKDIFAEGCLVNIGWNRSFTPYTNDGKEKLIDSVEFSISHKEHEKLSENIEDANEFIMCFVHFNAGTEELDGIYLSVWNEDGTADDAIETARVFSDEEINTILCFALKKLREEREENMASLFPVGREVTVSIKLLYDTGITPMYVNLETEDDENGEIGYYDFKDDNGLTVCMDGETCTVTEVDNDSIKLLNKDGEVETTFLLTCAEALICLFPSPLQEGFL